MSQLTASIDADGLTSPATLQAGDNITLECSGSIPNLAYSYTWSTTLDNIDGDPAPTNTAILNGFFLHGANTGTHTCTVTNAQFSFTAQSSFEITVQGASSVVCVLWVCLLYCVCPGNCLISLRYHDTLVFAVLTFSLTTHVYLALQYIEELH